jgi:hypothetical protein
MILGICKIDVNKFFKSYIRVYQINKNLLL